MIRFLRLIQLSILMITVAFVGCSESQDQSVQVPKRVVSAKRNMAEMSGVRRISVSSSSATVGAPALADSQGPGDVAPPLDVQEFVLGEPVADYKPGHIYVFNFFGTSCDSCLQVMTRLAYLQDEFRDQVTFVGVTDEDRNTVLDFLHEDAGEGRQWSDLLPFRIAIDNNQQTTTSWRQGGLDSNVPFAAIVGTSGKIEWQGHPAAISKPLRSVVAGEWDSQVARKQMTDEIDGQRTIDRHQQAILTAVSVENYREAVEVSNRMLKLKPNNRKILALKKQLLLEGRIYDKFSKVLKQLIELEHDNPLQLNLLAREIALNTRVFQTNGDDALKAALRASELTDHRNAEILNTVALIYSQKGNLGEAILWQKKAVAAAPASEAFRINLENYKNKST